MIVLEKKFRLGSLGERKWSNTMTVFCFDIDGTICTNTDGDYTKAVPFNERIVHLNSLFDSGHVVKMFTARGSTTGLNWEAETIEQLAKWGVRYHELILGKPYADIFIDDKAVGSEVYDWGVL